MAGKIELRCAICGTKYAIDLALSIAGQTTDIVLGRVHDTPCVYCGRLAMVPAGTVAPAPDGRNLPP